MGNDVAYWQIAVWTAGAVLGGLTFVVSLIKLFKGDDNSELIMAVSKSHQQVIEALGEHGKEDAVFQERNIDALNRLVLMADKIIEKWDLTDRTVSQVSRTVERINSKGDDRAKTLDDIHGMTERDHRNIGETKDHVRTLATQLAGGAFCNVKGDK